MQSRTKKTAEFVATGTDGRRIKVIELTEVTEGHSSSGPYSVDGTRRLQTESGESVNRIAQGKYAIVGYFDGTRIHDEYLIASDDPKAP